MMLGSSPSASTRCCRFDNAGNVFPARGQGSQDEAEVSRVLWLTAAPSLVHAAVQSRLWKDWPDDGCTRWARDLPVHRYRGVDSSMGGGPGLDARSASGPTRRSETRSRVGGAFCSSTPVTGSAQRSTRQRTRWLRPLPPSSPSGFPCAWASPPGRRNAATMTTSDLP